MKDILPELNEKEYIVALNKDYDIRFCKKNEVDDLVNFIDKYWKKDHIFVKSRKLLDWQHYDSKNGRYNFVIAKHKDTGEIHSVLGFVPTYQFDSSINNTEVWMCIWKAREDVHIKGLGSSLLFFLKSNIDIETISQIGISEVNANISKKWGFTTGIANHYYLANKAVDEVLSSGRHISDNRNIQNPYSVRLIDLNTFTKIDDASNILSKGMDRYKSKKYYINRYYKHPFYDYKFYALCNEDNIETILVTRESGIDNRKCIRIIDIIGDIKGIRNAHDGIIELLKENEYEYIDLVSAGISDELLSSIGFENRKKDSNTIIPNYFEPFLKENVDIRYAYKSINQMIDVHVFKGDSDQDRPNDI